jgi:hypothetical protein
MCLSGGNETANERGTEMTTFRTMPTEELAECLARSIRREEALESMLMPTSEQHRITATIRMELSERLGVQV